ncbi:MAG: type II secretion system protein GspL [Xanthomonadaceae bacterium]|nr:type II secretion system protein GspL [Xanthomonadaceae bacterium]
MSRILVRALPDGRLRWLNTAGAARVQSGVPAPDSEREVWAVLPAEDVLLMQAPRVARSAAQLQQALPYAIEDQLAAPIETQHVAWAAAADPNQVLVAVVARDRLDALLAALRGHGLEPDAVIPEPLLLAWSPASSSVLLEPGRAVLRYGEARAFVGHPDELAMFAGSVGAALDGIAIDGTQSPLPLRATQVREDALQAYAERARGEPPLNMLQGAYAPRRSLGHARRRWRLAALLGAVSLLLAFTHLLLERQQLARLAERQRQEMADLYRAAVPDATRVVDPELQLRTALAAAGQGGGDGLRLLALAAPGLAADAAIRVDQLELRERSLDLVVQAPDVAALDALRARLAAAAPVELTAATPGSQGVEGRLRLSGGAP